MLHEHGYAAPASVLVTRDPSDLEGAALRGGRVSLFGSNVVWNEKGAGHDPRPVPEANARA